MKTRHDAWTIPNLLSYFRILLIPVFLSLYLTAQSAEQIYFAAAVVGISGLTDLLDGKIARRFHQVTELGKFLDPLADKLTQGALVLCLASRFRWMWLLVAIFVVKEGFMAAMGLVLLRRGRKLDGAKWFGKVCTAVLDVSLLLMCLFPGMPPLRVWLMVCVCAVLLLFSFYRYLRCYRRPKHGAADEAREKKTD